MKRFLCFAHDIPRGGINDYIGSFDYLSDAESFVRNLNKYTRIQVLDLKENLVYEKLLLSSGWEKVYLSWYEEEYE
jgi:hypothetical protein